MITVQLLGGASLRADGEPLSGPPTQRHRIALLALIIASWPQPISRERAMSLLWPERDSANGRRLLNLAVHVLRAALGEGVITSTGDALVLNPSLVRCDLVELRHAIAAHDFARITTLYAGPLLDGFHLDDSTEFEYWLEAHRGELAHEFVGALLELDALQERAGDVHDRVGTCRRLVACDPHSGVYAQKLMRALSAAGDRTGARLHAAEHAQRLRADLELYPDSAVVTLAEELARAPARDVPARSFVAHPSTTTIAVLPFVNLGAGQDSEFFADGITEDVIAHLSRIRSLGVISRTSVMSFKNRHRSMQEIGAALGAATLVDGSVRCVGDRVRVVAKLIGAESGQNLWAETYDRELTDIFSIQTDVALHIAAALEAELTRDEMVRVQRGPTKDVQAYQLCLQGQQWLISFTPESLDRAVDSFERAVARDPSFALAFAGLAMAHLESTEHGATSPAGAYARAFDAAQMSLRLDPELGAAHCTMAHLRMTRDFDWTGAEQGFKRAIELSPSYASAYDLYGRLCASLDRFDEAITLSTRAQELDPLAHRNDLATSLLRAGRISEAIVRAEASAELDPSHARSRATLGWAYFLAGRKDEGIAQLERAVELSPGATMWMGQLAAAYAMSGKEDYARAMLFSLEERAKVAYLSPYSLAYIHTALGEHEKAIELLERAVSARAGPTYGIKGSFLFTPLHHHPRFRALLRELHLA